LMSVLEAQPQTGIDIAQKLGVTRGGITRVTHFFYPAQSYLCSALASS